MFDISLANHKPLREVVFGELRNLILTGKIEPGTRLMEVELATEMGVSRTPIREAIRKLEEEGLVVIEPRKGAYVSEVSVPDIVNILEVRENMDGLSSYLCAQRISEKGKIKLAEVSGRFNDAVDRGDMGDMIKYDTLFHKIIVEETNNSYLVNMMEKLQELVLRFRYIYYKDFRRAEEMPGEHKKICEAIIRGNAETARSESELHIRKLKELIIKESDSFTKMQKSINSRK